MPRSSGGALLLLLSLLPFFGCRGCSKPPPPAKETAPAAAQNPVPSPKKPRLQSLWDPATGRGEVRHFYASGDILRTCFHCEHRGYTGGLIIGNESGSGMGLYPRQPIRGFKMINVFCAQDESIWDLDQNKEYTYGWSENFGTGGDGERLVYGRGRVLEDTGNLLVLQSENSGGCYRVTKVAHTRAGARWWILATRVTNSCDKPVRFHFFSGDDPWLGMYRSSDGDVGWTLQGLVRQEMALGLGLFTAGGLYDLGNRALGQKEAGFSNQANFFLLDPAVPLSDLALFANAFAHSLKDVDPKRPLDNKTLTALNLGWIQRTLQPGQGFTTAMALGLAHTGEPGEIPRLPRITAADWSVWRRYLKEGNPASNTEQVEFAAELVELDLSLQGMEVKGTYHVRNRGSSAVALTISYPILVAADRPAPTRVEVDGRPLPVEAGEPGQVQVRFPVQIPSHGLARFVVRYTQAHKARKAVYMVTSALRWPAPIGRAVFVVRIPEAMGPVKLSHQANHVQPSAGQRIHTVVRHQFRPHQEMEVSW